MLAMFVAFLFYCLDIEMNSLPPRSNTRLTVAESRREFVTAMKGFHHRHPPPPAHFLCVCPTAVWHEGIVVVIAFRTGLGSGPRIFQL